MNTRYSESTGNFYPYDIDYGDSLPADVIEVRQADYEAALAARAAGNAIGFVDGQLVITPPPPVPFADQAAPFLAEVRTTREAILNRLAGIGLAALIAADTQTAAAVFESRQALLDITKQPDVVGATTMDDLKAAVLAAYRAITSTAPDTVRSAFNMVDA